MRNRKRKTEYIPVAENIYQSGPSYRVRITISGERYSKNFHSKRKAIQYRNDIKKRNLV